MFLVDILVYIISVVLCFFLLAIATVFYVSIKEWIRINKKKKEMEKKRNVRDN